MPNPSCDDAELVVVRPGELGEENVSESSPALACRLPTAFICTESFSALFMPECDCEHIARSYASLSCLIYVRRARKHCIVEFFVVVRVIRDR